MKTKTMILAAAGVALVVGLAAAATQMHGGHAGHGPHAPEGAMAVPHVLAWVVDSALEGKGVSDAERSRLLAIKDRVLSQAQELQAAHAAAHEEFKGQWSADRMDADRLHALVDARVEDLRRVLHTTVDGLVETHDTLTPEQRRAVIERLESVHAAK